jgi:aspartate oxidase
VDFEGKRIYVCCRACVKIVTAEPAKYVKMLEDQGITLDKAEPAEAPAKDKEAGK